MFNQYLSSNQETDLRNQEGIYYIDNKMETYKISLLNFNKSTEIISNHEDIIIL